MLLLERKQSMPNEVKTSNTKRVIKYHNGVVKCPNCGKVIFINMQVCNHCQHPLSAEEYRAIRSQLVYGIWGTVLRSAIIISIVAFTVREFFF